jgi:formylglycine-generating enzyme required for sulfatase activity
MVTWHDAQAFLKKLNEALGEGAFRLPSEAEWEFAARGGTWSKGFKYAGSHDIEAVAWYDENSQASTQPVKMKEPNELGIYDMSGNVWEWCQDWFSKYSPEAQTDPRGPVEDNLPIGRGGSWDHVSQLCRVSSRGYGVPDRNTNHIGIRVAH